MSVCLTGVDDPQTVIDITVGEWRALIAMAKAFGIPVDWDETNDPATYTAEQIKEMAKRAYQIGMASEWLYSLAAKGGAKLS